MTMRKYRLSLPYGRGSDHRLRRVETEHVDPALRGDRAPHGNAELWLAEQKPT
ncbi:MAG: hypothetical protein FWD61_01525 [Phycisphaerales bacterium]|nr:hypothetical protein [Phycisphaerales bacterium]